VSNYLTEALTDARRRSDVLLARATRAAGGETVSPLALPQQAGGGSLTDLGTRSRGMMQAGEQYRHFSGWVYACVRPIAQRIAGQVLRVARLLAPPPGSRSLRPAGTKTWSKRTRRAAWDPRKERLPTHVKQVIGDGGDVEILDGHRLLDTVNDPNPVMTRFALLYVTVASLELTARAFWWVRPRDAATREYDGQWEIWPLPASWVQPVYGERRLYDEWEVTPPDAPKPYRVPGEQIVYFNYPDPSTMLGTVSPLQAVARSVSTDEAMTEAQRRGLLNGNNPDLLITIGRHPDVQGAPGVHPERPILTHHQRSQLIGTIRQFFQGVVRHGDPLILDGLIQDAKRLSNTPREMDYGGSGKIVKERISQGFGVNPVIMGQLEGANRASATVADENFCNSTVNPKIELLSECMTSWLGPLFADEGERLLVWLEPAAAYDPEFELKKHLEVFDRGGISLNDLRTRLLGLPPVVGGDVCFVNGQLVPYEIVAEGEGRDDEEPFLDGGRPATDGGQGGDQNRNNGQGGEG
jgi:phage portal protein BeeE